MIVLFILDINFYDFAFETPKLYYINKDNCLHLYILIITNVGLCLHPNNLLLKQTCPLPA